MSGADATQQTQMPEIVAGVVLLLMWCAVVAVFSVPEKGDVGGRTHVRISTMDQGGNGQLRHEGLRFSGWCLGAATIAIFVGMVIFGCRRISSYSRTGTSTYLTLLVGGLLLEITFAMMCIAYWKSFATAEPEFIGPFPASLGWMLFGIWTVPAFFIVVYAAFFRQWIYPPEAESRFQELLQSKQK